MSLPPMFHPQSPLEQLADYLVEHVDERFTTLEALIMATKADLEAALGRLGTAVDGVKAAVTEARGQLTTMQQTLDRFVAEDTTEDAAYQAQIDDLKRQLADAAGTLDGAVASIDAMAQAVGTSTA